MSCSETERLIHGYLDGELDLAPSVEIERHLGECDLCARKYQSHRHVSRRIRAAELGWRARPALAQQIRHSLANAAKSEAASAIRFPKAPRRWAWASGGFAAGAIVATALLAAAVSLFRAPRSTQDFLADEILASHIRSLMPNHLTDVTSSNQHTVKPWFNGKLDFSPPVRDLAGDGFPLLGGRLDYVENHPVAALVYGRRKHIINVFVWPVRDSPPPARAAATIRGYHLIHWAASGMNFWAASDLDQKELENFVRLLRNRWNSVSAP